MSTKRKRISLIDHLKALYAQLSREELLAMILCGRVHVNGEKIQDHKRLVFNDSTISINPIAKYVSRGGEKLAAILEEWNIDVTKKIFIDAGCSSGGFTDCLLKKGAKTVYAVDVGYNQLNFSLRRDQRVRILERTNIMDLNQADLLPPPNAAVMDLSFRSIREAAAHLLKLVKEKWAIALVKPQFEWQNPDKNFHGVVKKGFLPRILSNLIHSLQEEGVFIDKIAKSVLRGRKGNIEFFFFLQQTVTLSSEELFERIEEIIDK